MTAVPIKYIHAGDISTKDAHALTCNVGEVGHRYQEIAIVADRVVGSWTYELEWNRGRARINSSHTDVQLRFRRKGIARALWFAGITRWNPSRIESVIGTNEGRDFLARMNAEVSYRTPDTFLWVKTRTDDEAIWAERCEYEARELLRRVGKHERAKAIETRPLKLIKAGS